MTLGQFSVAVGAPPKWVQNAFAVAGIPDGYSEANACALALARMLRTSLGLPLKHAWRRAQNALTDATDSAKWRFESADGSVALLVDPERFFTWFTAALSRARTLYAEQRRGRPRKRRSRGIAGAKAYGVDIGLLKESLRRTPAQRLQKLDEDVAFLRSLKVVNT